MRDYSEKRDYIRMTIDCKVSYKEIGSNEYKTGNSKNLSGRGLLFSADREIKIGTLLDIDVTAANDITPPLAAIVEVVRVEMMEPDKRYEIGCLIKEMK